MGAEERRFEASQYTLRAGFYYRAKSQWVDTRSLVEAAPTKGVRFSQRVGASKRAMERLDDLGIPPQRVFAHPRVLVRDPRTIRYYRNLALLPQKGVQRLAFQVSGFEEGRGRLTQERAEILARAVNGIISTIIESDPEWTLEDAELAAILNMGSQINGSWRNAIGLEGSRQIRALLTSLLTEEDVVEAIQLANGTLVTPPVDVAEAASTVRTLKISDGSLITFAPEPDVSIRDGHGRLIGTIEVKYGSDPAGALERYGAARKSFAAAVSENARVQNVYIANAITEEVRRRIDEDRLVTEVFEFTRLSLDEVERERFLRFIKRRLLNV
jgi:hypothetical protein